MSAPGFVAYPDTLETGSAKSEETCCQSEANDWFCTREQGHAMPHQAGAGFEGSNVYAEWLDAEVTS